MGRITVVGLGPAGAEYLTTETIALLDGQAPVWLRTARHPAAVGRQVSGSFDELYESLDSFDQVYSTIVARLLELAGEHGEVVYAVPGSPAVAERTVEMLRVHDDVSNGRVVLDVRPAMAFTDLCWNSLGIDPMAEAVTIVDALSLSIHGAGRHGPLLITQVHSAEVLDEIITILDDCKPGPVTVLQALGTHEEHVLEVPWSEVRTALVPDHLTSLWIPRLDRPLAASLIGLEESVRELRDSAAGAQGFTGETSDQLTDLVATAATSVGVAIRGLVDGSEDAEFDLEDCLADLLFGLVMATRLASEEGLFTLDDLADTAQRRHL